MIRKIKTNNINLFDTNNLDKYDNLIEINITNYKKDFKINKLPPNLKILKLPKLFFYTFKSAFINSEIKIVPTTDKTTTNTRCFSLISLLLLFSILKPFNSRVHHSNLHLRLLYYNQLVE